MKISELIKYLTERLEKYGDSDIDVEVGGDSKLPLPETAEQKQIEEMRKQIEEIRKQREDDDKLKPYKNVFDEVFPDDWDTKNPWSNSGSTLPTPKLNEWWKKNFGRRPDDSNRRTNFTKEYESLYQSIFDDPLIKDIKIKIDPKVIKQFRSDLSL